MNRDFFFGMTFGAVLAVGAMITFLLGGMVMLNDLLSSPTSHKIIQIYK